MTTKECWKPKNNKLLWWTYDKAAGGGWVFKKVQIFQQDLWPEPGNNTLKSSWLKLQTSTQKLWTFAWILFSQCRATNPAIFCASTDLHWLNTTTPKWYILIQMYFCNHYGIILNDDMLLVIFSSVAFLSSCWSIKLALRAGQVKLHKILSWCSNTWLCTIVAFKATKTY